MIRKFYSREKELEFLENQFGKRSFVVIYGRRRVGKTELIKKFIENKPSIYFLASQEPTEIQMQRLVEKVSEHFQERLPKIDDWVEAIEYIGEKLDQKVIIAIDEFPYLVESNKSIPSYFQKLVDEYLENSMLIITGSSIAMMESLLGHKSPLYGRRTGQIDLQPFDFKSAFPIIDASFEDKIILFSIFGGMPMYLSFIDGTIEENILKILNKNSFLYKEPEFILRQELRKPSKYMSILTAVALGNTRINDISNKTRIEPGTLSKYIDKLIELRLLEREVPVTRRKKKSKKSIYRIKDNIFNFWFEFVEPNRSDIERDPEKFAETILEELPRYVSKSYERICQEYIKYPKVGTWWYKDTEIDIVAIDESKSKILFGECKWSDDVDAKKLLEELKQKAKKVKWHKNRKEEYVIFAKSFSNKADAQLVDIKDLEEYFSN